MSGPDEQNRSGALRELSAVVTGASSGIGKAIATRFVAEGAFVTVASRTPATIEGAHWVQTDVADPAQVAHLMSRVMATPGRLDVLVNNAGVQVEKTIDHTSDDEYDLVMDVNVRGVFNCCRAAIAPLRAAGAGSIINIGSVAGMAADHGMAIYNASKGAVHALTKAIATDHGKEGIRCNAISPGWIMTAMAEAVFEAAPDPVAARTDAQRAHPLRRLGTPADVANLAVWLASDQSSFATGSLFTLDGGLTAQSPIGAGS